MFEIDYRYIDELFSLKQHDFSVSYKSEDYHQLHKLFDEPYNIEKWNFSFGLACSSLIENLFKEYVNENTIVISSTKDHPSVQRCIETFSCKEMIWLDTGHYLECDQGEFSLRNLERRLNKKDYENIFFISYGTNVIDGEIRDNKFFQRIFRICDEACPNTIKILDDCQGSLWIPRDYSIFDYILWTAHATLDGFDTAILISKPDLPIVGTYNVGEEFLFDNYQSMLKNSEFCLSWNKLLSQATGIHISKAPHIFNIELTDLESHFLGLHQNSNTIPNSLNIVGNLFSIDANRSIRLRVEKFVGADGKYLLLRALQYIYELRQSLLPQNL